MKTIRRYIIQNRVFNRDFYDKITEMSICSEKRLQPSVFPLRFSRVAISFRQKKIFNGALNHDPDDTSGLQTGNQDSNDDFAGKCNTGSFIFIEIINGYN